MAVDLGRLAVDSRRMSIQLEQFTDRYTEALGLSAAQAYLLLYILHHSDSGTSLTQMHREFGFAKPSLCGMLKRLQKNGFIQVAPCQEDGRRKLLSSTAKAAALEPVLARTLDSSSRAVYQGFSEEELAQLFRLQQKMLSNLSNRPMPEPSIKEASTL